eukprot:2763067-Pleurochrysis_carterae.AAC.1
MSWQLSSNKNYKAYAAIYADEGICGTSAPRPDDIGCIRSAAMFYEVPVATSVKTIANIGLRAILGCSTGSSCICNSHRVELGHPIATLPSDEGDYTSLLQNDVNSANYTGQKPRNFHSNPYPEYLSQPELRNQSMRIAIEYVSEQRTRTRRLMRFELRQRWPQLYSLKNYPGQLMRAEDRVGVTDAPVAASEASEAERAPCAVRRGVATRMSTVNVRKIAVCTAA